MTLPANGLVTVNLRTDYAQYSLPAGWFGSAKVTAGAAVAVVVNQLNDSANLGASYEGIPNSAGSTKIVLPYVVRKDGQCYYSNFTVRNTGTTTATVKMQYYNLAGAGTLPNEVTDSIWTEKTYNLYTSPPADLPDSFRGSVVITSTNNQPLVAISNLLYYPSTTCTTFNDSISYSGVKR